MRIAVLLVACSLILAVGGQAQAPESSPPAEPPAKARRLPLHIPQQYAIPAPPSLAGVFPQGMPVSVGNGLSFVMRQPDGSFLLYGLTGRGPTLPGPWVARPGQALPLPSRLFARADYAPALTALRMDGESAAVVGMWPLLGEAGKPLRGVPPRDSGPGCAAPLDLALNRLPLDPDGVFPGGVVKDPQRNCLWVCEDYGPSLLKVSTVDGRILRRYGPGSAALEPLPGDSPYTPFSGLCAADSGKVYASLQAPLRVNGAPAQFSRLVEFDPETELVRHFAYPIDKADYDTLELVRVSDICLVGENRFLVLEQGPGKKGWLARVFLVDIARATNIRRAVTDQGQPVEVTGGFAEWESLGIRMARKVLVLDLKAAGMAGEKPLAMTLLPGRTSLAVIGSGGWGVRTVVVDPAKDSLGQALTDVGDYVLAEGNTLSAMGRPTQARLGVTPDPAAASAALWLFTLSKDPAEYKVTWQGGLPSAPVDGKAPPKPEPKQPPKSGH